MDKKSIFSGLAKSMGGSQEAEIAANAIGYGGSAFILAALARALYQQQDPHESYAGVDSTKHLNTTIDDPVVSSELSDDLSKSVRRQTKSASAGDWLKWSVPIGSAMLMGGIGYKLVDDVYDKGTAKKLQEDKALLASLHKKLVMARALNARGQLSNDMYNEILREAGPLLSKSGSFIKTAEDGSVYKEHSGVVSDWGLPALGLAMGIAALASGYSVYQYQASRNPSRLRQKAIKSGLDEYAMQQSVMRPIEHSLTDDPKVRSMLEAIEAKKKSSPTETPMTIAPVTI